MDIDQVLDLFVTESMSDQGYKVPSAMLRRAHISAAPNKRMPWTEQEEATLRENLGRKSISEIASMLGRTTEAVQIHMIKRGIPRTRNQPGYLTANKVAYLLSIDAHTICGWMDRGIMPFEYLPYKRMQRRTSLRDLKFWLTRPKNWPYFDPKRIKNPSLQHLVERAQERWGDEWWNTRQVAEYHHCQRQAIHHFITRGSLQGLRCPNIGGRDQGNWAFWFVKKSDAIAWRPPKRTDSRLFTEGADRFILRMKEKGFESPVIGRMMKMQPKAVEARYLHLRRKAYKNAN